MMPGFLALAAVVGLAIAVGPREGVGLLLSRASVQVNGWWRFMGGWISLRGRPVARRPDLDWLARAIWTIHRHRSRLHVAWMF
jgi:hypothetical protein